MPQVSRRLMARRKVLVAAGVVAATAWGLAPAQALAQYGQRRRGREKLVVPEGEHFELLGESLRAGTRLGRGGHGIFEAALPVRAGALPVVMRTPGGERFLVDVLARDPRGPAGVADTAKLSLFIANQGDGATRTDEAQAHAARALAGWLAEREGAAPAESSTLPLLLTHRERQRAHPEGVFTLWK